MKTKAVKIGYARKAKKVGKNSFSSISVSVERSVSVGKHDDADKIQKRLYKSCKNFVDKRIKLR